MSGRIPLVALARIVGAIWSSASKRVQSRSCRKIGLGVQ